MDHLPDTLRARMDGAPVQTAPLKRRRSQLVMESAGEAPGMKPEPTRDPGRDDETESIAGGIDGTVGSPEEPARAGPGPKTRGA